MAIERNQMVYVVVRPGVDCSPKMVEIRGVFANREAAQAWVETLWEEGERPAAQVHHYFLSLG